MTCQSNGDHPDVFIGVIPGSTATPAATTPIDWPATKEAIIARLDVAAEYAALGLGFTAPTANPKGWRECRAIDRPDETPSATVNTRSGLYHDSGGGGLTVSFFDFAAKHGTFGSWLATVKHYAEKAGVELGRVHVHSGGRVREATYEYRDAASVVRYAVFRYRTANGKKSFTQHAADGRGGWKFGAGAMDGVEPLPYRLPELLAAPPDEPIWIVEGEKDADRLASLELVATTNHGGSSNTDKTWPLFVEHFRGRDCYIIADNDQAGRIHAARVAGHLHGVARAVKVVELPGLPAKGDVSDWLDLGGSIDELGRLGFAAPVWLPGSVVAPEPAPRDEPSDQAKAVVVRLSDIMAKPVHWLIPGKVPIGKLTLIAGQPGIGKSYLTMDLIARVTVGGEVPGPSGGECVVEGDVVLLSAEDDLADTIRPRLDAAGADCSRVHALTTLSLPDGRLEPFSLSYLPALERMLVAIPGTKLLVIDPITSYVGGRVDDHKNAQLRHLLEPLTRLAADREVAVVVVTHLNKGASANAINRVTGSLAYIALSRAAWLVVRDPDDRGRRLMLSIKNNLAPDPTGLAYRIDESGRVQFEQRAITDGADDVLREHAKADRAETAAPKISAPEQAKAFLEEFLPPGTEHPSAEIERMAAARGISRDALFKAKPMLGIRARKTEEGWAWVRPPNSSNSSNPSNSSTLEPVNGCPF